MLFAFMVDSEKEFCESWNFFFAALRLFGLSLFRPAPLAEFFRELSLRPDYFSAWEFLAETILI